MDMITRIDRISNNNVDITVELRFAFLSIMSTGVIYAIVMKRVKGIV